MNFKLIEGNTMQEHIAGVASKTTYSIGGTFAGIGAMTLEEWTFITGIGLGIGTFFVNWWYKKEHLSLERRKLNKDDE